MKVNSVFLFSGGIVFCAGSAFQMFLFGIGIEHGFYKCLLVCFVDVCFLKIRLGLCFNSLRNMKVNLHFLPYLRAIRWDYVDFSGAS